MHDTTYPEPEPEPEPVYIPVHTPLINNCSHCAPSMNREPTAFYMYPCGRTHLAHKECFLHHFRQMTAACRLCMNEGYGINEVNEDNGVNVEQAKRLATLCIALGILVLFITVILLLYYFT